MAFNVTAIADFLDERARPFVIKSILDTATNQLLNPFPGLKANTKIPTLDMDYDILQAGGSCTFTASGDIVVDQRDLNPKQVEVMTEFCIKDLEPLFFAQTLPSGSFYDGLDPEQAIFLDLIRKAIGEALEIGSWAGEEGGSSGAASLNLYDGILHIVANEIVAASIPASQNLGTVALTTSNTVGTFDNMREALPAEIFTNVENESNYILLCSGQTKQKYNVQYRTDFGSNTNNLDFSRTFIDGTNIEIVAVPGLTKLDSQFAMITRRDNWWYGFDVSGEETALRVGLDQYEKNVWVQSDFKIAYNVAKPEDLVIVNG